jgi:hypothetical protein
MTSLSRNTAVPCQDYFNVLPQRGNGEILNKIDVYSLDGSHKVESMSSILEGVSMTSSEMTLTTADNHKDNDDIKPRLLRELTALMSSDQDHEQFVTGQRALRTTHLERMGTGSLLPARTLGQAQIQATPSFLNRSYRRLIDDDVGTQQKETRQPENGKYNEKFIVWQIIPMESERKFGRVLFKFSTCNGVCFLLKYKYAVQFVQLMQKKTNNASCSVFYQAFEYHGNASSIFKADSVTSWLGTTIDVMQPPKVDVNGKEIRDNANVIKKPSEMNSIKRIDRYLNRRRLKKLIRGQLAQTFGRVEMSRGRLFFSPFQIVWSVLTGKNRSSL